MNVDEINTRATDTMMTTIDLILIKYERLRIVQWLCEMKEGLMQNDFQGFGIESIHETGWEARSTANYRVEWFCDYISNESSSGECSCSNDN